MLVFPNTLCVKVSQEMDFKNTYLLVLFIWKFHDYFVILQCRYDKTTLYTRN